MHVDHSGLLSRLKRPQNIAYAGAVDAPYIDNFQFPDQWTWLTQVNEWAGTPSEHAIQPKQHLAYRNRPSHLVPLSIVHVGEYLSCGGYNLKIIDSAGHTLGQIGLWDERSGSLFCADHLLERVAPNISIWDLEHDCVQMYCQNLLAIKKLPVKKLFVAHGRDLENIHQRIDELLLHCQNRLAEVEHIVQASPHPVNAFFVATAMDWSGGRGKSFERLHIQQRWFAFSETLAYLQSLLFLGKLTVTTAGKVRLYAPYNAPLNVLP
jgi:glyoxylase-like metal-dependent hydrolase (beta-lactamase superfamily II)